VHFKCHLARVAELPDIHIDSPHLPATAPLKVAFVSPFNLHDSSSGASQSVRTMLEQLAERGASCHALTACCFDLAPGEKLGELLRAKGLAPSGTIKEINMPVWRGRLRGVDYNAVQLAGQNRQQLSAVEEIFFRDTVRVWLAQNKPDIVLTFGGLLLDIEIQRCARAAGALVAFYLANPGYARPETFVNVDLILANSAATRQHYLQTMNIQSHSIGLFVNAQATLAAQHDPQFITFVNPTAEKGVALFLKLVLRAAAEAPDMRFLVVDSRNSFAAALQRFRVSALALKSITLLPKQESMTQVYANTSVLLMPSLWFEGAGRILIEANANGIPVLATNRGGIPETLGGAGCLLPIPDRCATDHWTMPDDDEVAPWWNELSRLLREPAYRQEMSARALAVARTQSLSVKGAMLDTLLRGALAARTRAGH
jgi:glycosyltransferase involved in cell wall biosynthesis